MKNVPPMSTSDVAWYVWCGKQPIKRSKLVCVKQEARLQHGRGSSSMRNWLKQLAVCACRWLGAWQTGRRDRASHLQGCWCSRGRAACSWRRRTCPPSPCCTQAASSSGKSSPSTSPGPRCGPVSDAHTLFLMDLHCNALLACAFYSTQLSRNTLYIPANCKGRLLKMMLLLSSRPLSPPVRCAEACWVITFRAKSLS